jgi:Zn-dependent protease with chaperone function
MGVRTCPECSAPVETVEGYPDWCDACEWNVRAPETPEWGFGNRFDALLARLGRRSGDRLSSRLLKSGDLDPRWTAGRAAAYAIALAVIATSLALMGAAIVAVAIARFNLLVLLLAALLFGIGWFLRPRLYKADRTYEVPRERAPELHALVGDIARALETRPPDVLLVAPEYNAWWAVLGWRRRRVLMLGAGLLAVLSPDELVAVAAHELGHARNGDARHGLIVGGAVDGLAELYAVMGPGDIVRGADPFIDAAAPLAQVFQRLASLPVLGLLMLEAQLLLGDKRRAEFLADARAAQVAGRAAAIRLHEKLLLGSVHALALQRAAHGAGADGLFAALRDAFESVPEREQARRRAVARREGTRLDATHPPTGMRIALLERGPAQPPRVILDGARASRLEAEIATLEPQLAAEMIDRERGRHYHG